MSDTFPRRALRAFTTLAALVCASTAGALDGALPPSQNFDLTYWKLTLPSGDEVSPTVLNSGYSYDGVFYTDPETGGMVFRCPNIAGTTTNSKYSRTELRGMLDPTNNSARAPSNNWMPEEGGQLRAELRVDQVSTTGDSRKFGRVIIGQIHGPKTEPVRLYYSKKPGEKTGRVYAASEAVDGSTTYSPDIVRNAKDGGIPLGQPFRYSLTLRGTRLEVRIVRADGRTHRWSTDIDEGYLGTLQYFKAGAYNQNNTGDSSDYVQTTFFALEQQTPFDR